MHKNKIFILFWNRELLLLLLLLLLLVVVVVVVVVVFLETFCIECVSYNVSIQLNIMQVFFRELQLLLNTLLTLFRFFKIITFYYVNITHTQGER